MKLIFVITNFSHLHILSKYVTISDKVFTDMAEGETNIKTALIIVSAVLAVFVVPFLFLTAVTLPIDVKKEYDAESPFYRGLLNTSSLFVFKAARVKFVVTGWDKVPESGRFLLVGNHRSNFDPITAWTLFRKRSNLSFVSKPENFKIPWFGRIIRRCCFMAIDRTNPRNAMKTLKKAALMIKEDRASVGIYPEGTRSRDCKLLPFHNGVFKIAKDAEVPIAVVAMRGTELIKKNFPLRSTTVYVDIVDVITAEEVAAAKTGEIGERVREGLLSVLGE